MTPEQIERALERLLPNVEKPGRYTGGELNSVAKDWGAISTRVCLAFPDIYDIGQSNLGVGVLYDLVNQRADALAERVFNPWSDMEAAMRAAGVPLYSLETKHAVREFDLLGISLPYEQLYSNVLNLIDLAGLPLLASERGAHYPLIIAGGHATYNPEPMADFIDAFVVGEGEAVLIEIVTTYQKWKADGGADKQALLKLLAKLWGVYVPAFYEPIYNADGTIAATLPTYPDAPKKVLKRIVPILPPPPTKLIVPYVSTVHNRYPIEIMRGCTRGCRFCHAGMITRPVRERSVDQVMRAIDEGLKNTGFEEVALLSLSSSDYDDVLELVKRVGETYAGKHLSISLPSLRLETASVELMELLKDNKRGGFTFAPEAATERMREIINKPVSTEQLMETARAVFSRGWTTIKLYFMIGHPAETLDDVQAIADLCKRVRDEGRKYLGGKVNVHAGVSTFVPKPHTPFQWVPCDTVEQIIAKQSLLKRELRGPGLKLNWNRPEETQLEAWFSRGDRRLGQVLLEAWKRGAKFDAWQEHFNFQAWQEAFAACGLDPKFYTHRPRLIDETFPWDHIDVAVKKQFLAEDYLWSLRGQTRIDCRERCFACGILPRFTQLRSQTPAEAWECPEVKPKHLRGAQRATVPVSQTVDVQLPVAGD
jgi:radical SAM family uncharacterized protein